MPTEKAGYWRVIKPKKDPFKERFPGMPGRVMTVLSAFARQAQAELSFYPAAQTAYVRTGTLGRRWTVRGPRFSGGALTARVGNNTAYARKVQGSRQEPRFKELGWQTTTDVINRLWPKYRPLLVQAIQG